MPTNLERYLVIKSLPPCRSRTNSTVLRLAINFPGELNPSSPDCKAREMSDALYDELTPTAISTSLDERDGTDRQTTDVEQTKQKKQAEGRTFCMRLAWSDLPSLQQ